MPSPNVIGLCNLFGKRLPVVAQNGSAAPLCVSPFLFGSIFIRAKAYLSPLVETKGIEADCNRFMRITVRNVE